MTGQWRGVLDTLTEAPSICGECGEPYPCSLVQNRGMYTSAIVAKHVVGTPAERQAKLIQRLKQDHSAGFHDGPTFAGVHYQCPLCDDNTAPMTEAHDESADRYIYRPVDDDPDSPQYKKDKAREVTYKGGSPGGLGVQGWADGSKKKLVYKTIPTGSKGTLLNVDTRNGVKFGIVDFGHYESARVRMDLLEETECDCGACAQCDRAAAEYAKRRAEAKKAQQQRQSAPQPVVQPVEESTASMMGAILTGSHKKRSTSSNVSTAQYLARRDKPHPNRERRKKGTWERVLNRFTESSDAKMVAWIKKNHPSVKGIKWWPHDIKLEVLKAAYEKAGETFEEARQLPVVEQEAVYVGRSAQTTIRVFKSDASNIKTPYCYSLRGGGLSIVTFPSFPTAKEAKQGAEERMREFGSRGIQWIDASAFIGESADDSRPRYTYVLPDGREVPIIHDKDEIPKPVSTYTMGDGKVVTMRLKEDADTELEATPMRDGRYAVRPKGQLGTIGWSPKPWNVKYVTAKSPEQAIQKARAMTEGKEYGDWKVIKTITSHSGLYRWLGEIGIDNPMTHSSGFVAKPASIPSPYRYGRYTSVHKWNGKNVVWFEVAHKRYEVFEVPSNVTILDRDPDNGDNLTEAVAIDWNAKADYARTLTKSELLFAINDCIAAGRALGNGPQFGKDQGYYHDEASIYRAEITRREKKLKPGECYECGQRGSHDKYCKNGNRNPISEAWDNLPKPTKYTHIQSGERRGVTDGRRADWFKG